MFTTQILIIAVLTIVLAGLQYVLSLLESKVPGLILPILTGLGAVAICIYQAVQQPPDTFALVLSFILSLLLLWIPAALLVVVYCFARRKRRTKYGHTK